MCEFWWKYILASMEIVFFIFFWYISVNLSQFFISWYANRFLCFFLLYRYICFCVDFLMWWIEIIFFDCILFNKLVKILWNGNKNYVYQMQWIWIWISEFISVYLAVQSALHIRAPKYSFDFADDSKKAFQCICVVRGIHDQMNIDSRWNWFKKEIAVIFCSVFSIFFLVFHLTLNLMNQN